MDQNQLPGGILPTEHPLLTLQSGADGRFQVGRDGVRAILTAADRKVELICFADKILCYVKSALHYPALYPLEPARIERPIRAVLMDLDGTSVRSEEFWIWIIERTTGQLLGNPHFELDETDLPYVSGHSVSEHLQYCIEKYCPGQTVETARGIYFEIVHTELDAISRGKGRPKAFQPAPGLADFLRQLKANHVKIGLVTSGLYEKAWPEILSAFRSIGLGDPRDFYDAIITAGFPLRAGQPGTLGELTPKPHPWLYAETARVGLGIDYAQRHSIVGIEDSAAGVIAIRLAGFAAIGIAGGNIRASGVDGFCHHHCPSLAEVGKILFPK